VAVLNTHEACPFEEWLSGRFPIHVGLESCLDFGEKNAAKWVNPQLDNSKYKMYKNMFKLKFAKVSKNELK